MSTSSKFRTNHKQYNDYNVPLIPPFPFQHFGLSPEPDNSHNSNRSHPKTENRRADYYNRRRRKKKVETALALRVTNPTPSTQNTATEKSMKSQNQVKSFPQYSLLIKTTKKTTELKTYSDPNIITIGNSDSSEEEEFYDCETDIYYEALFDLPMMKKGELFEAVDDKSSDDEDILDYNEKLYSTFTNVIVEIDDENDK